MARAAKQSGLAEAARALAKSRAATNAKQGKLGSAGGGLGSGRGAGEKKRSRLSGQPSAAAGALLQDPVDSDGDAGSGEGPGAARRGTMDPNATAGAAASQLAGLDPGWVASRVWNDLVFGDSGAFATLRPGERWLSKQPKKVREFLDQVPPMTLVVIRRAPNGLGGSKAKERRRKDRLKRAAQLGIPPGDLPDDPIGFSYSRPCAHCLAIIRRCPFIKRVIFSTGNGNSVLSLHSSRMSTGHLSHAQRLAWARKVESLTGGNAAERFIRGFVGSAGGSKGSRGAQGYDWVGRARVEEASKAPSAFLATGALGRAVKGGTGTGGRARAGSSATGTRDSGGLGGRKKPKRA